MSLGAASRRDVAVLANRGVAGIDGTVSTAIGAALAHEGPAFALLGDLTLLHDTTGLVIGPDEPRPDLTIVVLNDGGGGIFGLLEQGAPEHAGAFERVFGTPHSVDLAALAAATDLEHVRVDDLAALPAALEPRRGIRLARSAPTAPPCAPATPRSAPPSPPPCRARRATPGRRRSRASRMGRSFAAASRDLGVRVGVGHDPAAGEQPRHRAVELGAAQGEPHSPLPSASIQPTGPA